MDEGEIREDLIVVIGSDEFGNGDAELGKNLMKTYLYSMTEADIKPQTIIFINNGVFLTVEGSPVLEYMQALVEAGVSIYSCGACLNYHGLESKLAVGEVTNMYSIVEWMNGSGNVIKL